MKLGKLVLPIASLVALLPAATSCMAQLIALAPTSKPSAADAPKSSEWHQWRGPNRDGISPEKSLLREWPAEGPKLAWRVEGLGGAFSSVAVSDGMIFTMGNRNGATFLIGLNAADGAEVWATRVGDGDRPNCTPTVDGDLVYAVGFNGDLLCARAKNGEEVWRVNFGRDFGGKMMSGWGYSESPLVDGNLLVCTPGASDAMIAALDKRTGQKLWTTAIPAETGPKGQDGAGYSSIVIGKLGGTKQYVQLVGRGLIGVNAKTGKLIWGYNKIANGTANVPTPIIRDDLVFCSSGYNDGGTALLKVSGATSSSVQELYYFPDRKLQNHHGGMILLGDFVYMGHGHNQGFPICVDLRSGETAWAPGRGPGKGSAAISYADERLYFRYEDGTMALLEATPSQYQLKGQFELPSKLDRSWSHPAISGGKLYLRDQDVLLCYDIRR